MDQWQLYRDDPLRIVLPPYSGLGVYGGIRGHPRRPPVRPLEAPAVPALGRRSGTRAVCHAGDRALGELLQPGPLRIADEFAVGDRDPVPVPDAGYACPPGSDPAATLGQHFQPMFLYESLSGLIGRLLPDLAVAPPRQPAPARRPAPVFFIWYGAVRFVVELLKADNWLFFGVPTAQIIAAITVAGAAAILVVRHADRPGSGRPTLRQAPYHLLERPLTGLHLSDCRRSTQRTHAAGDAAPDGRTRRYVSDR